MSAVVLPAASADFTSTQVIFSNSTRSVCARGAARADPAASIREAVPPAINISKSESEEAARHMDKIIVLIIFSSSVVIFPDFRNTLTPKYSDARQKITQIHYYHDYS